MTNPVKYQENATLMAKLENESVKIQKKAITLGRLPTESEIGSEFPTYIKGEDGEVTIETTNTVTNDVVVARNPESIGLKDGVEVFNEWLVPKATWMKNYGVEAQAEMMKYQRLGSMKAIEVTDEVLTELGSTDGQTATIAVSWDNNGMRVHKGGYLTDQGYGLAPDEFKKTYQIV